MVEAGFISCMGGLIGIVLGVLPVMLFGAGLKAAFSGIQPVVEQEMLIYGISISIGVGFIFGLYPAIKALRFNPVTALQYE
jgi:putative ABC transport system permease protein